jgi:hypothetical protein
LLCDFWALLPASALTSAHHNSFLMTEIDFVPFYSSFRVVKIKKQFFAFVGNCIK